MLGNRLACAVWCGAARPDELGAMRRRVEGLHASLAFMQRSLWRAELLRADSERQPRGGEKQPQTRPARSPQLAGAFDAVGDVYIITEEDGDDGDLVVCAGGRLATNCITPESYAHVERTTAKAGKSTG